MIVYQDSLVTLHHADYREHLDELRTLEVAAVVTDPPYGGATKYAWDRWPDGWPADVASFSSALWVFGTGAMFWRRHDQFKGWKYSQEIIWEKHNGSSLHRDRFRRVHEIATLFYRGRWGDLHHETPLTLDATARAVKSRGKPVHHQGTRGATSYATVTGGPRLMRSIVHARSEHGRAIHPTQKPLAAVRPLVEYSVPRGGLVVDLFGGSATTALAARQSGRRAIVFEIDEQFALRAAARLAQQEVSW